MGERLDDLIPRRPPAWWAATWLAAGHFSGASPGRADNTYLWNVKLMVAHLPVERTNQSKQAMDGTVIGDLTRKPTVALSAEGVAGEDTPQSAEVEERELGEVE